MDLVEDSAGGLNALEIGVAPFGRNGAGYKRDQHRCDSKKLSHEQDSKLKDAAQCWSSPVMFILERLMERTAEKVAWLVTL